MNRQRPRPHVIGAVCSLLSFLLGGGTMYLLWDQPGLAWFLIGAIAVNGLLAWHKWGWKTRRKEQEAGEPEDPLTALLSDRRLTPTDRDALKSVSWSPGAWYSNSQDEELDALMREEYTRGNEARRAQLALTIDLLAVRAQNRHATWMKWLTVAITVATIAQVVIAVIYGN